MKEIEIGTIVRIRRGRQAGRIGKVVVYDTHKDSATSYHVLKIQLNGSGQVVEIYSEDDIEQSYDIRAVH